MGNLRYVVEQTLAVLHHVKKLAARWERRTPRRLRIPGLLRRLLETSQ
jgi:hypothetical protein